MRESQLLEMRQMVTALFTIGSWARQSWLGGGSRFGAIAGYICVGHLGDVFGGNRDLAWQILGDDGPGDPTVVEFLRGRVFKWGVALAMSATCIGIGFESRDDGEGSGAEAA